MSLKVKGPGNGPKINEHAPVNVGFPKGSIKMGLGRIGAFKRKNKIESMIFKAQQDEVDAAAARLNRFKAGVSLPGPYNPEPYASTARVMDPITQEGPTPPPRPNSTFNTKGLVMPNNRKNTMNYNKRILNSAIRRGFKLPNNLRPNNIKKAIEGFQKSTRKTLNTSQIANNIAKSILESRLNTSKISPENKRKTNALLRSASAPQLPPPRKGERIYVELVGNSNTGPTNRRKNVNSGYNSGPRRPSTVNAVVNLTKKMFGRQESEV